MDFPISKIEELSNILSNRGGHTPGDLTQKELDVITVPAMLVNPYRSNGTGAATYKLNSQGDLTQKGVPGVTMTAELL